jgi:hypothetical protein
MMKRIICSLAAAISAPLAVNASILPYGNDIKTVTTTCHYYGQAKSSPIFSEPCAIHYSRMGIAIGMKIDGKAVWNAWVNPIQEYDIFKLDRHKTDEHWWHNPESGCLMNDDHGADLDGICWDATL